MKIIRWKHNFTPVYTKSIRNIFWCADMATMFKISTPGLLTPKKHTDMSARRMLQTWSVYTEVCFCLYKCFCLFHTAVEDDIFFNRVIGSMSSRWPWILSLRQQLIYNLQNVLNNNIYMQPPYANTKRAKLNGSTLSIIVKLYGICKLSIK
jgi:hypothetical protein